MQSSWSRKRSLDRWKPGITDILSLLALVVAIIAAWIALDTKREQYDERLSVKIEPYEPSFIHSGIGCGPLAMLIKPYRITLINTGNSALTITRSMIDIGVDNNVGRAHSQDIILLGEQGSQTPLPLKLEASDSRVYYTMANYLLPPSVTTLLCSGVAMGEPAPDRNAIVQRLLQASVDLMGNPIHPAPTTSGAPSFLWAADLSDLPPISVQVETARGATVSERIIDKATP